MKQLAFMFDKVYDRSIIPHICVPNVRKNMAFTFDALGCPKASVPYNWIISSGVKRCERKEDSPS